MMINAAVDRGVGNDSERKMKAGVDVTGQSSLWRGRLALSNLGVTDAISFE